MRGGPFLQGLAKRAVCTGAYKVGFRFLGRLGQAGRNEPYMSHGQNYWLGEGTLILGLSFFSCPLSFCRSNPMLG